MAVVRSLLNGTFTLETDLCTRNTKKRWSDPDNLIIHPSLRSLDYYFVNIGYDDHIEIVYLIKGKNVPSSVSYYSSYVDVWLDKIKKGQSITLKDKKKGIEKLLVIKHR